MIMCDGKKHNWFSINPVLDFSFLLVTKKNIELHSCIKCGKSKLNGKIYKNLKQALEINRKWIIKTGD